MVIGSFSKNIHLNNLPKALPQEGFFFKKKLSYEKSKEFSIKRPFLKDH